MGCPSGDCHLADSVVVDVPRRSYVSLVDLATSILALGSYDHGTLWPVVFGARAHCGVGARRRVIGRKVVTPSKASAWHAAATADRR